MRDVVLILHIDWFIHPGTDEGQALTLTTDLDYSETTGGHK